MSGLKLCYKAFLILFLVGVYQTILAQGNYELCKIIAIEQEQAKHKMGLKSAPRTAEYDVNYYRLEFNITPSSRFFNGKSTTYFTTRDSISSLILDFNNMLIVDSVQYHGTTYTNHSTAGFKTLEVFFPALLPANTLDSVSVYYRGTPNGPSGGPPFASTSVVGGDILWTLSEPYGAQEWWPCKNDLTDKADSVEIIITTPLGNRAAANGLLISLDTIGSNVIYHWKTTYPTVSYLVAIAVGNYDFYQNHYVINGDSLLMHHFLEKNETFIQSNTGIRDMMVFFDSLFGEYPFIREKYGHASFGFGGGMEHQTISFMGNYGGELKAHELAHQWFGNKITCGSWSDLWLNEGFATYLTGLTYNFNVVHSSVFWPIWLRNNEAASLAYPNGSVYRYGNDTLMFRVLFNNQVYAKGAMTLHTLRYLVGDSAFFAGVRNFINDSSLVYGFAKTPHLKGHMEAASGMNLTEFFNDWVYGKGFPIINTSWNQSGNSFNLTIQQIPSDASVSFFETPVPYRLIGNNIDTIISVNPSTNNQQFTLNIPQSIHTIELDPENRILASEGITTTLSMNVKNDDLIIVYPNPSNGRLYINSKERQIQLKDVSIYNAQGQLVPFQFQHNYLDVSYLERGIYYVVAETTQGTIRKKFNKID